MSNESNLPNPAEIRKQAILVVAGMVIFLCVCVAALAGSALLLQQSGTARATAHSLEVTATHGALATERAGFEFVETFDGYSNGWTIGGVDNEYWRGRVFLEYGVYSWQIDLAKRGFVSWRYADRFPAAADFDLYVDVRRNVGSAPDMSYGLQFRRSEATKASYYAFAIRDNGYYRLLLRDGEHQDWITLIRWTPSRTILSDQWNTLGVSARGEHLTLIINDQVVAEYSDDHLERGGIGLFIDVSEYQAANIWYDNLSLELR